LPIEKWCRPGRMGGEPDCQNHAITTFLGPNLLTTSTNNAANTQEADWGVASYPAMGYSAGSVAQCHARPVIKGRNSISSPNTAKPHSVADCPNHGSSLASQHTCRYCLMDTNTHLQNTFLDRVDDRSLPFYEKKSAGTIPFLTSP